MPALYLERDRGGFSSLGRSSFAWNVPCKKKKKKQIQTKPYEKKRNMKTHEQPDHQQLIK